MDLHIKLAKLRKEKGLSQIELAEKVNVSRQAISRWEVGTAIPTKKNLLALSELYNVPLHEFFYDEEKSDIAVVDSRITENDSTKDKEDAIEQKKKKGYIPLFCVLIVSIIATAILVGFIFSVPNRVSLDSIQREEWNDSSITKVIPLK